MHYRVSEWRFQTDCISPFCWFLLQSEWTQFICVHNIQIIFFLLYLYSSNLWTEKNNKEIFHVMFFDLGGLYNFMELIERKWAIIFYVCFFLFSYSILNIAEIILRKKKLEKIVIEVLSAFTRKNRCCLQCECDSKSDHSKCVLNCNCFAYLFIVIIRCAGLSTKKACELDIGAVEKSFGEILDFFVFRTYKKWVNSFFYSASIRTNDNNEICYQRILCNNNKKTKHEKLVRTFVLIFFRTLFIMQFTARECMNM